MPENYSWYNADDLTGLVGDDTLDNCDCAECRRARRERVLASSEDRCTYIITVQRFSRIGQFDDFYRELPREAESTDPSNWRDTELNEIIHDFVQECADQSDGLALFHLQLWRTDYFGATHREMLRVTDDGIVPFENPERRTCSRCGNRSYACDDFFYRRGDGWSSWCKECHREYSRVHRSLKKYGRRFGVEIEFTCYNDYDGTMDDPVDIAEHLTACGVPCTYEDYTHAITPGQWKIVHDSSVDNGYELVSPPLHWKERDQIVKACEALRDCGCDVDGTCGLHVHHEVRDLTLKRFKRLVMRWNQWQRHTDALTSRRRRDGQWSAHYSDLELSYIENAGSIRECANYADRYRSLNLTCYPSYGTVEVRQHQGTLNPRKIIAWIAYGQAIIDAANSAPDNLDGHVQIDTFLDALPFREDAQREYLKDRAIALA